MKTFIAAIALFFGLTASSMSYSQPQPWQEVGNFVETTTKRMMTYVGRGNSGEEQSDWKFSAVWLRVQAQFGIQAPWLASLRIVPEVEIVFEEN